MIEIRFEEREKIGLQYILESLHGCSPFGQERIRRLRYYTPDEREELEQELRNVERAAAHAEELKDLYDQICVVLCQMKDIRGSLRRCRELEVPDHVELFELKGYLQRLETLRPLFEKLREIRAAKKQVEEQLYRAQTDAEKDDLRQKRVRICAEEDSEEMKVRRAMGAALAPLADDLMADADTAGRLDFLIQKALFAHRYGGVRPEITDTALELTDMINPELCDLLREQGRSFVPVSISLDRGAAVITGANMGGKSVAMKTVALNVLLLQAGFLVCAKSARMPLFWSVHMLFDDLQSIQSGLSGFGSEIVQFQKALAEVEQGYSLFLLDEFARGTNPDEGAIIVQAVTRYLNDVNAISLLTTHYDKVAEHARVHYQIIGLRDVDPEQIRRELAATNEDGVAVIARHMNYGLYRVEGRSDCPRDALNICRMLSLKPEILEKIEQSY